VDQYRACQVGDADPRPGPSHEQLADDLPPQLTRVQPTHHDRAPRAQEGEADVDRVLLMRVTVKGAILVTSRNQLSRIRCRCGGLCHLGV
jgi:hypothetical protein